MAKDSGLPAEKATEQAEQAAERYTCRQRVGGLWCRGQAVIQQTLTDARSLLAAVDMAIKTLPEPFLEGSPGWGESLSLSEGQTASGWCRDRRLNPGRGPEARPPVLRLAVCVLLTFIEPTQRARQPLRVYCLIFCPHFMERT